MQASNGVDLRKGSSLVGAAFAVWAAFSTWLSAAEPQQPIINSVGMKLLPIPAGKFRMGQQGPQSDYQLVTNPDRSGDADWDERPEHEVTVSRLFHLGATEVTLGQFRKFRPKHLNGRGAADEAATGVTWHDAVAFCEWLSKQEGRPYRLPTEAEWEYACRAGTTTVFHTGDKLPDGFLPWFGDLNLRGLYFAEKPLPAEYRSVEGKPTLAVGATPANAWGLHDMHGNVAEWCADWYGPYEADAATDPVGRVDGDFRVRRGGHHSTLARMMRSANRSAWLPESADDLTGFRVVLGETPATAPLPVAPPPRAMADVPQILRKIQMPDPAIPYFAGPKPYVVIPPGSLGPVFSKHNHSPGICECPNGDLLAVWYSCVLEPGSELSNVASRLRGGEGEWEPASVFWDGPDVNDHGPKIWWDGATTLYFFSRGHTENIVRTSTDNGATWSKATRLWPHSEFGNQPIAASDGRIFISLDNRQASLAASADAGKSWTFTDVAGRGGDYRPRGTGPRHAGIHAPLVELPDGRLMAAGRYDRPEDQARFNGKTPFCFTVDGGKTWTYEASPFPAISTAQRQVLLRLKEGPLLFCSFTDQARDWKNRVGLSFKRRDGGEFTGFGLFAAVSLDDGKTWPLRRLITPGGKPRQVPGIDNGYFELGEALAERSGYLAACQTRDRRIHLISSKNHYVFNLAWLKELPAETEASKD
jgi:formylglycine-generating enzyme required for sulfatase activity